LKVSYVTKKVRFYLEERNRVLGVLGRWALMAEYEQERWAIAEWDTKPKAEIVKLCVKVALRAFDYSQRALLTVEHVSFVGKFEETK